MKAWTKERAVENGKEALTKWSQPGMSDREGGLEMKMSPIFFLIWMPEQSGT